MKEVDSTATTIEHPMTSTFEVLFEELVERSQKILDIADRLKKYPRDHDEFYQAMADLYVIVSIFPVMGQAFRRDIALRTGQWWAIPWWREDQYYPTDGPFTKDEVEDAFAMLQEIFDAKWFLQQRNDVVTKAKEWLEENSKAVRKSSKLELVKKELDKSLDPLEAYEKLCALTNLYFELRHPLLDDLQAEGFFFFNDLVILGRDLHDVKRAKRNLIGDIQGRLRDSKGYFGARFELWVLALLIRQEFSIQRNPRSGTGNKKGEFQVSKGSETLFVEMKRLDPSSLNKKIDDMLNLIHQTILSDPLIGFTPNILHLKLSKDLIEKAETEEGLNDLWQMWQEIAQQITDHVADRLMNQEWGHYIVPGLAEYDLHPREEENVGPGGHFSGLPFSQEAEAEKILQNAVEKAVNQLPKDELGLLIVNTPFPVGSSVVQHILSTFGENPQKYQHMCAMILVFTYADPNGIRHQIELVRNPNSLYDVTNYAAVQAIFSLRET